MSEPPRMKQLVLVTRSPAASRRHATGSTGMGGLQAFLKSSHKNIRIVAETCFLQKDARYDIIVKKTYVNKIRHIMLSWRTAGCE